MLLPKEQLSSSGQIKDQNLDVQYFLVKGIKCLPWNPFLGCCVKEVSSVTYEGQYDGK